jgi:hypothetical protein
MEAAVFLNVVKTYEITSHKKTKIEENFRVFGELKSLKSTEKSRRS